MKTRNILMLLFCFFLFNGIAQERKAKFVQFNNFSADFEVPQGKTWEIQSIFSNAVGNVKTGVDGSIETPAVRIFIKTINGDIKTDWQGNRFGPQVYQSNNTSATVAFPITFPEGTKFGLVMISGDPGKCEAFNGSGFMTLYEVTNTQ